VVAFDFAGFSNKKQVSVTLNKWTVSPSQGTWN
jgi:hypothetical protein